MVKIAKCFSVFLFVLIISLTFSNTSNAESYLNRTVNERSAGIMEAQELVQQINNNELSFTRLDKLILIFLVLEYYPIQKIKFMGLLLL
ncbi:hypothetical protein [Staphylococcus borealis]|uniref:hypothetical protein n=1 Tax=Staphylococcus borealis TaxID=2742203 RepID=UPI00158170F0|nr:hypothetical protein [Staphylococcus borealis]NUI81130.1 hypothetical protein [Staphylococcus borealis]